MHAASAIAPITGRFRHRVIRDIVGSVSLGLGIGYWFWYGVHMRDMKNWKDYDAQVRHEMQRLYGRSGPTQLEAVAKVEEI
ncbi:hypothetical protein HDU85_004058 [Gaertneriomyces sp. JEL0708]|nr:hypothetical protein HDU85_004058 [Gaertneriomyces sp. JEL0708]